MAVPSVDYKAARAQLKQLHPDLLPVLTREIHGAVETTVLPGVFRRLPTGPSKKGHVRSSVKASGAGNVVYVEGGSAGKPYYGWLDFGGVLKPDGRRRNTIRRPVLRRGRYIYPAIDDAGGQLATAAERAVNKVVP